MLPMLPILTILSHKLQNLCWMNAAISDTIDLAAIASTVAGVTGAKADEEKTTPKVSMAVNPPISEDRISSESILTIA